MVLLFLMYDFEEDKYDNWFKQYGAYAIYIVLQPQLLHY